MQCFALLSIQRRLNLLSYEIINKITYWLQKYADQFINRAIVDLLIEDCKYFVLPQEITMDYTSSYLTRDWDPQLPIGLFGDNHEINESQHVSMNSLSQSEIEQSQQLTLSPSVWMIADYQLAAKPTSNYSISICGRIVQMAFQSTSGAVHSLLFKRTNSVIEPKRLPLTNSLFKALFFFCNSSTNPFSPRDLHDNIRRVSSCLFVHHSTLLSDQNSLSCLEFICEHYLRVIVTSNPESVLVCTQSNIDNLKRVVLCFVQSNWRAHICKYPLELLNS